MMRGPRWLCLGAAEGSGSPRVLRDVDPRQRRASRTTPRTTSGAGVPGAFDGETLTRRRFMTGTAHMAGLVAGAAAVIPALGFALGPVFERLPVMWQPVGDVGTFPADTYVPVVIRLTPEN